MRSICDSYAGEHCWKRMYLSHELSYSVERSESTDVDARMRTLRDKVSSAHVFSSLKRVSGLSIPLQPSPLAPSPARKKSRSSNRENRGIALSSTKPGTYAESLLPDPLDILQSFLQKRLFLQLHRGFQGMVCLTELLQTMNTITTREPPACDRLMTSTYAYYVIKMSACIMQFGTTSTNYFYLYCAVQR